jgi:hypothetical protein
VPTTTIPSAQERIIVAAGDLFYRQRLLAHSTPWASGSAGMASPDARSSTRLSKFATAPGRQGRGALPHDRGPRWFEATASEAGLAEPKNSW